jgi:hypothetical protein
MESGEVAAALALQEPVCVSVRTGETAGVYAQLVDAALAPERYIPLTPTLEVHTEARLPSASKLAGPVCACDSGWILHFAPTLARLVALAFTQCMGQCCTNMWRIAGCEELQADVTADVAVRRRRHSCRGRDLPRLQVLRVTAQLSRCIGG